ncbi:hypothetical protein EI94DRAFT_1789740 [Lactarius quietus]|nr:hypothetical protein EI94DRAFT_1789740 [Lactarius quietus]
MRETFTPLTRLRIWSGDNDVPVLPREFLGRSAPHLQELILYGIPLSAFPIILPSASDLVKLSLYNIPQTGYISPDAMVAGLATLTRLRDLWIGFHSPNSRPNKIPISLTTRTVLPALTYFYLRGVRENLEDFVARIDAPRLDRIEIDYFSQLIDFEVPQLSRFIDRSETFRRPMRFSVEFFIRKNLPR